MKAYIATPDLSEAVTLMDAPNPAAERDSAVISVEAVSLNRGEFGGLSEAGAQPGWDFAGRVTAEALSGKGPRVGDRVAGVVRSGAWAEQIAVPVGQLGLLPDDVSSSQGSTLGIAGLTALRLIRSLGNVAGKRILVTGASGAVGRFAVQLAEQSGASVTALVSTPERKPSISSLRASEVVSDPAELAGPFDFVIDGVGGPVLEAAIRSVGANGTVVTYGIAGGAPAQLRFADFRNGPGSCLRGFFIWQSDLDSFGIDLTYLADLVKSGALEAHVALEVEWSELNQGLTALKERRTEGKVVARRAG
ncbi:zinc-binding dehydrogenase [Pseudarthrobacter sp. RMG13]|uniref:Zinc-binding dehydrogenase n=1 Tax=Pseudarthrobacter humi TaxID=2952523 RepID=A0ABT1LMM4_9MICC|nr:zinc-binding dehydrogenase [Pseudarthrobacter humi]MCP8999680.1 zinc-binding dehydrogenase [Pseudarthrobacter humi]